MPKPLTFAQARLALQTALKAEGWTLSPTYNPQGRPYKVPYATSPSGVVRLWFKPQAVYGAIKSTDLGEARSIAIDMRTLDPATFAKEVELDMVRSYLRMREAGY